MVKVRSHSRKTKRGRTRVKEHSRKLKNWGVGSKGQGLIGYVKARNKKEALKKARGLPMYDYWDKSEKKAWVI